MKTSIEERAKEAQRVIQRELLFEDCSVGLFPIAVGIYPIDERNASSDIVQVAVVSFSDEKFVRTVSRKMNKVVEDFGVVGSLSRDALSGDFIYSLWIRKEEKLRLSFKDIKDELRMMWQQKTFRI